MGYDPLSGLVFDEKVVKASRRRRCPVEERCLGSKPNYVPPDIGSESLEQKSIRCLLRNLDLLEAEALHSLPEIILKKLWTAIRRAQLDSLRVWKMFASTSLGDRTFMHRWNIKRGHCDLPLLVSLVTDTSCCWLVDLTIVGTPTSPNDLVGVPNLHNLRNLSLISLRNRDNTFSDRTLRAWSEAAVERGAFAKLETLFVYNFPEVKPWSLKWAKSFPVLQTFCVNRCGFGNSGNPVAEMFGWVAGDNMDFMRFLDASNVRERGGFSLTVNPRSWVQVVESYLSHKRGLQPRNVDNYPVLSVELGLSSSSVVGALENITCFEPVRKSLPDKVAEAQQYEPAAKRRKIASGKSMDLASVLAEF